MIRESWKIISNSIACAGIERKKSIIHWLYVQSCSVVVVTRPMMMMVLVCIFGKCKWERNKTIEWTTKWRRDDKKHWEEKRTEETKKKKVNRKDEDRAQQETWKSLKLCVNDHVRIPRNSGLFSFGLVRYSHLCCIVWFVPMCGCTHVLLHAAQFTFSFCICSRVYLLTSNKHIKKTHANDERVVAPRTPSSKHNQNIVRSYVYCETKRNEKSNARSFLFLKLREERGQDTVLWEIEIRFFFFIVDACFGCCATVRKWM